MEFLKKHFILSSILLSEVIGILGVIVQTIINYGDTVPIAENFSGTLLLGEVFGSFFIYPLVLTAINLFFLFRPAADPLWQKNSRRNEGITLVLGFVYTIIWSSFCEIMFQSDWQEVLANREVHTPIWTGGSLTVLVLSLAGIAGYLFLSCVRVNDTPPLVIVLAMALMYLGIMECIFWIVQLFSNNFSYLLLCLFPFNCIVLAAGCIRRLVRDWQPTEEKQYPNRFLNAINQKLMHSKTWPFAAFLLIWPVLGILIGLLVLLGQRPDSLIRAWTETSDWNLSTRIAPQNVCYDEHYLCTVAAGGHKKIVKPLRLGQRHGHQVIVNRQLCVANAFEQILEEKTPSFLRHVRHFYDTYGFPIARLIHSPYLADVIYVLMKPLEWIFLLAIYMTDAHPEDRIAMQYMPPEETIAIKKQLHY